MQITMAILASTLKVVHDLTPHVTLTERLFDYVPVGHRFVMKVGATETEVFDIPAGDNVGEDFERFRDQRWKEITRRLSRMPIKDIGKSIGAEHSKRCSCDPLVPSSGVYTALVKAEGDLCDDITK